jgi:IS30 family transposase
LRRAPLVQTIRKISQAAKILLLTKLWRDTRAAIQQGRCGMSLREIAEETGAHRSAVHRLKQRLEREAREAKAGEKAVRARADSGGEGAVSLSAH